MRFERGGERAPILIVACVAQTPERPHYGIFTRRQIDSVRRAGINCDLLALAGYRSPLAYALAAARLARASATSGHRYSLVHAHGGETAIAASSYRRASLLISYLGSDLLGAPNAEGRNPLRWRVRNTVIRQHSRIAVATITKAPVMASALPAAVRARNHVLPNGVDLDRFKPRSRREARAALGWELDERVVLFASDPAMAFKRHRLAQEACRLAGHRLPRVRLHVAHGVPGELMPTLMNASDCLLHPAAVEGSPNVIKEALACNLPIVATPVGDIPERLAGVRECHVCSPSADELAAALVACLEPPRRSNGRQFVAELDERVIAQRLVGIYTEIIGDAAAR